MRTKAETDSAEAEKRVRDIRRATRRQYSAEEKIRIVIAGLRGEDSIAELCRKEGINQNLYYRWSKDFLEAGKKRLASTAKSPKAKDHIIQVLSSVLLTTDSLNTRTWATSLSSLRSVSARVQS